MTTNICLLMYVHECCVFFVNTFMYVMGPSGFSAMVIYMRLSVPLP